MESGLFEQSGTPVEIYTSPANEFVARFVGFENILPAEVLESGERLTVRLAGSDSVIAVPARTFRPARGASVSVAFRAAHVTVARPEDGGTGLVRRDPGDDHQGDLPGAEDRIRSERRGAVHPNRSGREQGAAQRQSSPPGDTVDLTIDSELCALMPTGRHAAAPPTDHSDDDLVRRR